MSEILAEQAREPEVYKLEKDKLLNSSIAELLSEPLGIEVTEKGTIHCRRCDQEAVSSVVPISIHESTFGEKHAGFGEVRWIPVPFCGGCDEGPVTSGCLHLPVSGLVPQNFESTTVDLYLQRATPAPSNA